MIKQGPQVWVRAEEWSFHSPECARKQRKHTGVESKERAGPKLQRGMRDRCKQLEQKDKHKKVENEQT
jgi:hypothetical protein